MKKLLMVLLLSATPLFATSSFYDYQQSLNWDEFKNIFPKYIPAAPEDFFISLGESHLFQAQTYALYDELFKTIRTNWLRQNYKICFEPIGNELQDSNFFTLLKENAQAISQYGQSPSLTNFTKCREEGIRNYFFYSGFHHQIPLVTFFPENFLNTNVSTNWEQSIYNQSKLRGLSVAWMDLLLIETNSLNYILSHRPENEDKFLNLFKLWLDKQDNFQKKLEPLNTKNKILKNLLISILPLKIDENNSHLAGQHFFLVTSNTTQINYSGALIKKIFTLPQKAQNAFFHNIFTSKKAFFNRFHFESMDHQQKIPPTCSMPTNNLSISCSSQLIYWLNAQDQLKFLLWEPEKKDLRCFDHQKELDLEECF